MNHFHWDLIGYHRRILNCTKIYVHWVMFDIVQLLLFLRSIWWFSHRVFLRRILETDTDQDGVSKSISVLSFQENWISANQTARNYSVIYYIFVIKYRVFASLIWTHARALYHTPCITPPLSHPFITSPFGTPLYFSCGLPRGFSTWMPTTAM